MLKQLNLENVGPAPEIELVFGKRLNLFTGDNGLGKSFLLDVAWWALTRQWPGELNPKLTSGKTALPTNRKKVAKIKYSYLAASKEVESSWVFDVGQGWKIGRGRPGMPGLVFYALADGSFAVWDPARNYWKEKNKEESRLRPLAYVFSPKEVWDGLQREDGAWLCNGLIRDWASWQKENGRPFQALKAVLDDLSSSAEEKIIPGPLTRISLDDVRDMPTLRMPYGQDVAVVHASSGMKRIIALAYFLVWCWEEHLKAKELMGEDSESRAVFLVDEVECHLHPKWQRTIIPALIKVMDGLNSKFEVQLIGVTHSPLIMASVEPFFKPEMDAWFDLDLGESPGENQGKVLINKCTFHPRGDVSHWLMSEAFDLPSARSIEAELLIQKASDILTERVIDIEEAMRLDSQLRRLLSGTDPFWLRWRFVGEKQGWLN